jgi:hypothetical protein
MGTHGVTGERRGPAPETVDAWAAGRRVYLDNLKVVAIAAIIAIHGVLGYVGHDQYWSYADVQEVTLATVTEVLLFTVVGPFTLFVIPLLFLVAGLLAQPSLQRNGPGRFIQNRLLRLGVPFALFVLGIWPALMYALYHPLGQAPGTYAEEFFDVEGNLDAGPMWFVGVLLVFSGGYAGLAKLRRVRRPVGRADPRPESLGLPQLLLMSAVVAAATFGVRLVYPFGSESGFFDLNLWEWPACLAAFALGVTAAPRGWLDAVPDRLRRRCRTVTLGAVVGAAGLGIATFALGDLADLPGGWHWAALLFAAVESVLAVFGSVWWLSAAQRWLGRASHLGGVLGRSAYAAFLVQGVPLLGLAVALRPVPVPAEIKALLVAAGGVVGSFALGWFLVKRVPGLSRVL